MMEPCLVSTCDRIQYMKDDRQKTRDQRRKRERIVEALSNQRFVLEAFLVMGCT